jgi:hypothetical protein
MAGKERRFGAALFLPDAGQILPPARQKLPLSRHKMPNTENARQILPGSDFRARVPIDG